MLESAVDDLPVVRFGFPGNTDITERVSVPAVQVGQKAVDDDISRTVILFNATVVVLRVRRVCR